MGKVNSSHAVGSVLDSNLYGYLSIMDNPLKPDQERRAQIRSGVQQWNRHMGEQRDLEETCRDYLQSRQSKQ